MLVRAIRLARPEHWLKNLLVFFPVLLSERRPQTRAWLEAAVAAAAFCLASSAAYILNDIRDRHRDRLHPRKKGRPLAAGTVSVGAAAIEVMVLLTAALVTAAACGPWLIGVVAAYLLLQAAYSVALKRKMMLDAICIALGFVLRAAGGAVAIRVSISPWLFVCTFTLCLFLGFCKRRNEAATLGPSGEAEAHRWTLAAYTPELLTHLITLSGAIAVVSFLMYTLDPATIGRLKTNYLVYTLPIVIYVVFRFAMLSMMGSYADPMDLILHDRPFQFMAVLWIASVLAIIAFGPRFQAWLEGYY